MPERRTIGVDELPLDDLALEALAAAHAAPPPPELRARVLAAARVEKSRRDDRRALARWRLAGAIAAAVGLVLGGLLARNERDAQTVASRLRLLEEDNGRLAARIEEQGRALASVREALAAQADVLRVVSGPRTLTATLAPQGGRTGSGRVVVDPASGEAAVVVAGVEPPGEARTYELWAIRSGRPPEPAGLLAPGPSGLAAARVARVERPAEISAFAVSIEPAGGSTQPTGPIVLAGPLAG